MVDAPVSGDSGSQAVGAVDILSKTRIWPWLSLFGGAIASGGTVYLATSSIKASLITVIVWIGGVLHPQPQKG